MRTTAGMTIVLAILGGTGAAQSPTDPLNPQPKHTDLHQAMPIEAKEFVSAAGDSGKAEVTLAALADKRATSDRVRLFAARLHKDHSTANDRLVAIAGAKNLAMPAISPSKQVVIDRLTRIDAAGFDRAYMTQMVDDHKKAIDLYTRGTASPDADIRTFASQTLPTIKGHLAEAEEVVKGLGFAGGR